MNVAWLLEFLTYSKYNDCIFRGMEMGIVIFRT